MKQRERGITSPAISTVSDVEREREREKRKDVSAIEVASEPTLPTT